MKVDHRHQATNRMFFDPAYFPFLTALGSSVTHAQQQAMLLYEGRP